MGLKERFVVLSKPFSDGVANVNLQALIAFHRAERKVATLTAVQPPGRFGALLRINKHAKYNMSKN